MEPHRPFCDTGATEADGLDEDDGLVDDAIAEDDNLELDADDGEEGEVLTEDEEAEGGFAQEPKPLWHPVEQ